ncbi:hypothetical protein ACWGH8_12965 [Nonomuraea muscovyensis]|jgi:hypothetical protein|uniref:Secreted protein n=1 Tax=Nonomuraea muscovyensis TaxID=1124761 RepID=A0A7X0C3W2_9ACTN|nr:hypothetical protein [Nonomuraea muscovyensis]MBB6346259.1 hypothetical protein [Nonomuraea muscovyensis]MDF2711137.1 hypothetical protein [Nonomuraea muscovyensis]
MRSVPAMAAITALLLGPAAPAQAAPAPGEAGDPPSDSWKRRTSLLVMPQRPRQNNVVRILAHCPTAANHALIGSTAFRLKGSARLYREVGLGLSDRGLGRRSVAISYYAPLGHHVVHMTCVKVTIDKRTRVSHRKVISRYALPLQVRRFRIGQFF